MCWIYRLKPRSGSRPRHSHDHLDHHRHASHIDPQSDPLGINGHNHIYGHGHKHAHSHQYRDDFAHPLPTEYEYTFGNCYCHQHVDPQSDFHPDADVDSVIDPDRYSNVNLHIDLHIHINPHGYPDALPDRFWRVGRAEFHFRLIWLFETLQQS